MPTTWTVAIRALACVGMGRAHHSISPHALITLEEGGKDGRIKRWIVEGPALFRLKRMGVGDDFLKAGDPTQSWVEFLNSDPLGREAWCGIRTKGITEEISKLLANPCN